ncbi:MAG: CoA pyrophosphatase [Actinomycetota bacterium]|nr:CoA pyrophosphatase [Actinomycetota bacterium]
MSDPAPLPSSGRKHVRLPEWLEPVRRSASEITVEELTRFVPPEGQETRYGAVLLLFGEGASGPDVLLTERAHGMRSHPGQVSFPGGSVDEQDRSAQATALREAEEETGLDPAGVAVFATLPELWLPPSNFAVTPVLAWWREESPVAAVDPREVHAVFRVPVEELIDPQHRISVRHPSGWKGPGFLIGDDKDLILWGFTAGIIARVFDFAGWTRPWDANRMRDLPGHMLTLPGGPIGAAATTSPEPNTDFQEQQGTPL